MDEDSYVYPAINSPQELNMEENKDAATVAAVTREHRDTDESTDKDSGAKKAGQLDTL